MTKELTMPTLGEILQDCEEVGGCLEWSGVYSTNGYPIYCIGALRRLHLRRVVFNMQRERTLLAPLQGKEGQRLRVIMTCGNRRCLNPEHMVARTEREIQRQAAALGSYSTTSRRAAVTAGIRAKRKNLKCSMELAREIRASTEPQWVLADKHKLSRSMVGRIQRGELWRESAAGASVFNLGNQFSRRRQAP